MTSAQGTAEYMAPEQLNPEGGVGPKADMWAFGATLVHVLSGRPPFAGSNLAQIALRVAVQRQQPELPWQVHASPALAKLLQGCFAYDPESRLSAAEAVQLLEEAMHAAGVEPPTAGMGSPKSGASVLDLGSSHSTSTAGAGSSDTDAVSDVPAATDTQAGAPASNASTSSTSGLADVLHSGLRLGDGAPQLSTDSGRSTPPLQQGQLQPDIKPAQKEPARQQPKLQQQRLRMTQQQSGAIFITPQPRPRPPEYRAQAAAPPAPVRAAPQPAAPQTSMASTQLDPSPAAASTQTPAGEMRMDGASSGPIPSQTAAANGGKQRRLVMRFLIAPALAAVSRLLRLCIADTLTMSLAGVCCRH
jgi:serine/threonine protein kinase